MAAVVTDLWVANIFVNFKQSGAGETYYLKAQDWATARLAALQLADARALLIAKDCEIYWVAVRKATYPAPSWPLLQNPIRSLKKPDGSEYWGPLHTPHDALWWYLRAEDRKWSTRPLRFYQAAEVLANVWKRQGLIVPSVTPPRPLSPGTSPPGLLFQHVLGTIRDLTCHAERLPDVAGLPQWKLREFSQVRFTKVGRRRVGGRFWRCSWEANVWVNSPDYSPCGCAVTAMRRTYSQKARFYVDGGQNAITYYTAYPNAKILPFPTIFWGWAGYKIGPQTTGPGEIGAHKKSDWTPGYAFGDAPGVAPTGPPSRFLGFDAKPFNDSLPTPILLRPGCDMPVPLPIRVNNSPQTVNDANVTWITVDAATITLTDIAPGHVGLAAVIPPPPSPLTVTNSSGAPSGVFAHWIGLDSKSGLWMEETSPNTILVHRDNKVWNYIGIGANLAVLDPGDNHVLELWANTGPWEIGHIIGEYEGRELFIRHGGTVPLILKNISVGPTMGGGYYDITKDYVLVPDESIRLVYHPLPTAQWRIDPVLKKATQANTVWPAHYISVSAQGSLSSTQLVRDAFLADDTDHSVLDTYLVEKGFKSALYGSIINPLTNRHWGLSPLLVPNVNGVQGGVAHRLLTLWHYDNINPGPFHIKHLAGAAAIGERINTPGGVDLPVYFGCGVTLLWNLQWYVIGMSMQVPPATSACETPGGVIDGVNPTFTLATTPVGSVMLFVNGVLQTQGLGNDFTIASVTITFNAGSIPPAGSSLLATYQF